ncbi:MAG: chromosomal replication initiator protein DnaA [Ruminococcus sp.]|nr:chromosomal replication initiator protein DnaA [Ruminococcus sp.]
MNSLNEAFDLVVKYCENDTDRISSIALDKWIKSLEPYKLEGNTVFLLTENNFTKNLITAQYKELLEEGFENVLGFSVKVELLIRSNPDSEENPMLKNDNGPEQFDNLTFENFVKGKSNELAYAFSTAVAGKNESNGQVNTNQTFNPLFIYGDSGLGKTHLMKAIENEVRRKNPDIKIIYTTGENFLNELIEAIKNNETNEFHNKYRGADFLLIDDIQFIAGKETVQQEFFHTFNDLYNARKQIVLTADIAPSKINLLEDRIRSRFALGVQVDIQPPDFETRMAIVKRKAELVGLQLGDNIARLIAEKIKTNIRLLEGTVNNIKGLTDFTKEPPSMAMAQKVVKEIIIQNHPQEITVDRVLNEVAAVFKITPEDIRSTNRSKNISRARKVAIYLLKEVKGMTYLDIGNELNKNHSTMTIHYQSITEETARNKDLKHIIEDLEKNLKNN